MRHFCKFCHMHSVHDPCLPDKTQDERNFFMAMYASHLAMGNTLLSQSIKSNTIRLYLKAASMLSEPRRLMNPLVSLSGSKSSWIEAIIQEQRRWELMPNRQEPVTVAMVLHVCKRATNEHDDSFISAFKDWLIIGMYTGNRKSEWAQEHHIGHKGKFATWDEKLGGDGSSKAFTQKDFVLLGKNGRHLYTSDSAKVVSRDVEFLEIRYRFQKNKDNGQKLKYSRSSNLNLCPVRAGLRIRRRAQRLSIPSDTPIAVCRSSKGSKMSYITDKQIDTILQSVAKSLYNLTNLEDIRRFSSHSIRVGACVLLHSSGKDGEFIKLQLRWKSDTFRLYLRNTTLLAGQHCSAVANILDTAQA